MDFQIAYLRAEIGGSRVTQWCQGILTAGFILFILQAENFRTPCWPHVPPAVLCQTSVQCTQQVWFSGRTIDFPKEIEFLVL